MSMRAIIPVAGVGSRLRPHTYTLPKVLLHVAGKPILGHIIDKIVEEGIGEATFVVGHMGDKIRQYVTAAYPDFRADFVEQEEQLGLGHAIWLSRGTIGNDPVLIILGDTIFDVNLRPVLRDGVSSLGVKEVEDPRRFGVAVLKNGAIERLVEKPEQPVSRLAIVGLYYLRNAPLLVECLEDLVARDIRTKGEYQLTDALQLMLERGERMTTFPVEGWFDCGKPETLLSTNRALLDRGSVSRPYPGVVINEPVHIAATARLENCVIGPYATVGDGAAVTDAIVRNSIIGEKAVVRGVLLEDSLIGAGAVAAGSFGRVNIGDASDITFT